MTAPQESWPFSTGLIREPLTVAFRSATSNSGRFDILPSLTIFPLMNKTFASLSSKNINLLLYRLRKRKAKIRRHYKPKAMITIFSSDPCKTFASFFKLHLYSSQGKIQRLKTVNSMCMLFDHITKTFYSKTTPPFLCATLFRHIHRNGNTSVILILNDQFACENICTHY